MKDSPESITSGIKLPVPLRFRRGSLRNDERASVDSALRLLELIQKIVPIDGARILDFGCGVKLVQGLMELDSPQEKYCGVDVYREMINYLADSVRDKRYEFATLSFQNEMYNKDGEKMTGTSRLPIREDTFKANIITMFSVITHMIPDDALASLQILRGYASEDARLIFSSFINPNQQEDFIDKLPDRPLLNAIYRKEFLESLVKQAGWKIESFNSPIASVIQHYFVCSPT